MTESMRRELIVSDLISAVQRGIITNRERRDVTWQIGLNGWQLGSRTVMTTDLRNRVLQACSLLRENEITAVSDGYGEESPRDKASPSAPTETFGLLRSDN
jgi:hypothetical protein